MKSWFEKTPLKSKKFICMLVIELMLFSFAMTALLIGATSFSMTPVLVTALAGLVFVAVGYIGGVAWLDKWTRVAHIGVGGESPNDFRENE